MANRFGLSHTSLLPVLHANVRENPCPILRAAGISRAVAHGRCGLFSGSHRHSSASLAVEYNNTISLHNARLNAEREMALPRTSARHSRVENKRGANPTSDLMLFGVDPGGLIFFQAHGSRRCSSFRLCAPIRCVRAHRSTTPADRRHSTSLSESAWRQWPSAVRHYWPPANKCVLSSEGNRARRAQPRWCPLDAAIAQEQDQSSPVVSA